MQPACALEVEVIELREGGHFDDEVKGQRNRVRVQCYALPNPQLKSLKPGEEDVMKHGQELYAAFGVAKEVPTELSVQQSSFAIQEWIANCQNNHRSCSVSEPKLSNFPSRVLDIGFDAADQKDADVLLIASRDIIHTNHADHLYRYATLSHCWGKAHVIRTTKDTLAQRLLRIKWEELPKTFQDAIKIVRALKIRYLWIDSLCIIQDDALDWKYESALMGTVYSNGYINLAATGAFDSRGGCLGSRKLNHLSRTVDIRTFQVLEGPVAIFVRPSFESIHYRYSTRRTSHPELPDSKIVPLLSRAWVFQERHLAPRTLHFHPSEMVMECKTTLSCECTNMESLDAQKLFEYWFEIVEEYSKLLLTQESDRLPALIGIAATFQRRLGAGYLAGLWQADIGRGLLWDVKRYESADSGNIARRKRRTHVPSWPWASLHLSGHEAGVIFTAFHDDTFRLDRRFRYLDTDMTPKAADSSFALPDDAGTLFTEGAAVSAIASYHSAIDIDAEGIVVVFDCDVDDMVVVSTIGMNFDVTGSKSLGSIDGTAISCLLIRAISEDDFELEFPPLYICTLVLQPSKRAPGSYERIGVLDIRGDLGICQGAEVGKFSIV
ncbi:hypothetical protein LSUE1_G006504 [Lachnellula suecica]|uniref:Heterokaryon incompatibility domain-containing protein n=1 Tax=Lachnellula suecica TaxID=602035 RepID=A0A8T9C3L2_9HELO|nr:hypothetical protein LSUE1_G006504 [Lachnellula suecica]